MTLLTNIYAIQRVRCILDILDGIEGNLVKAQQQLAVDSVGSIQLHPLRAQGKLSTDSLEKEYSRWAKRLADILGIPLYPYSARFRRSGPGSSLNVNS